MCIDLWVNKPRKEKEVVLPLIRVFLFRLLGRMFSLVLGLCTRREFYHAAPRIPIKMISWLLSLEELPVLFIQEPCFPLSVPQVRYNNYYFKINGCIQPFFVWCLGAGKTTLLNYLSGRDISTNLKKDGDVFVNGVNKKEVKNFSAFSAYVQQDDILFQTMTVRECLEFAAKLKLPGPIPAKIERVNALIKRLKLTKC